MAQTNFNPQALLLGQIADNSPKAVDSYVNPLLAQISAITVGGNDDGTYAVRLEGGGEIIDGSFAASSDAVADIIDGLIASLALQPGFPSAATAVEADPDLELTFTNPGISYVISFPSNPSGNMSVANSQEAGGTNIGLGLCVAQGGTGLAVLPTGEAVAQTSVITLGGTTDGTFTMTVTGNGLVFVGNFVASSSTAAAILGGLLDTLEDSIGFDANCDGAIVGSVLTLNFSQLGVSYAVVLTSNPGTDMVLTQPVAPAAGDVLLGLTTRNIDIETNIGGDGVTEQAPGTTLAVARQGVVTVRSTTTQIDGGAVFVKINTATVAEPLGSISATDDATTTRLGSSRFRGARTGAGLTKVAVNIP
jgi:hypothetical protein